MTLSLENLYSKAWENSLQAETLGGAVMRAESIEMSVDQTLPEVSQERAATFKERDTRRKYLFSCGDDRGLTPESFDHLSAQFGDTLASPDEALQFYGGVLGLTRVALVAAVVQYGPELLDTFPEDFVGCTREISGNITAVNPWLIPIMHSAQSNENNSVTLNTESEKGLGCAYAANLGTVNTLNCKEELLQLGLTENPMFADGVFCEQLTAANVAVGKKYFSEKTGLDRGDFAKLQMPIGILAGAHAHPKLAIVVENFKPDHVSNSRQANEQGIPFYNLDMTQSATFIIQAMRQRGIELAPEMLLASMDQDVRATRQALASSIGADASALELQRYGSMQEALQYLKSI